jgi:hypothetical protein
MKLAIRVYFAALILLTLTFAAFAQSDARSDKDPRNTMPTVGTGGAIGGPTGLFTVYDGQTLRRGEYTLSFAMSNYDRDPGNVDITSYPASFQVGLTNRFELFYTTEAYRQVKVNSPRNLSSFYLPNSQVLLANGMGRPPAIVLSPQGPGTSQYPGMAIFRPTGAPFAIFPYYGSNAGTFGLQAPFFSGNVFGFAAGSNATLGPPRLSGSHGADLFPGIGSVYGSILPGIVLRTQPLLNQAGVASGEAPQVFTLAPSYLPDAPFINQQFGVSSFNDHTLGFKWRMTGLNNPIGFGVVGAYTYSANHAQDAAAFQQMNNGAGAGGRFGDITLALFADARVARWANISANVGYKYTSQIKSSFGGTTYTLLDRPDELSSSIGVDFPVNRWFQPIAEFRSLMYVGGRTPNAFENNPMDGIAGARIFPTRWTTIGLAYRYNFNSQNYSSFDQDQSFSGSVVVPCRPGATNCSAVTLNNSFSGVPPGFLESTDAHGYIVQLAIGRRNKRQGDIVNIPAVINSVNLSSTTITLGCPAGTVSDNGCSDSRTINVTTSASDAENDVLTYNYTVSGGRIVGTGANVQWDLSGATAGTYTITTGVDDGCGVCGKTNTQTVTVADCAGCHPKCDCATLSVQGPGGVTNPGETMTFTLSGARSNAVNWSVSAGTIESGQGTSSITVRTATGMTNVTATAEITGTDPGCNCQTSASETAAVSTPPGSSMVDEFGPQKADEIKARVDNFFIQLNNDPNAKGYIVNYGTAKQIAARRADILKAISFRKYDANRVVFVDGGDTGSGVNTRFWLVPAGATPPTP